MPQTVGIEPRHAVTRDKAAIKTDRRDPVSLNRGGPYAPNLPCANGRLGDRPLTRRWTSLTLPRAARKGESATTAAAGIAGRWHSVSLDWGRIGAPRQSAAPDAFIPR